MKTFGNIRELTGRKPTGQLVVNKKMGRIQIMVYKDRNQFVAYIDGDRLDAYRSKAEAENCLLYTSPSPRDLSTSRMPSSA